jgi:hypothetical protein
MIILDFLARKSASPSPNPDWLEVLVDSPWNSTASLAVDRWLDHQDREFGVSEVRK